MISPQVLPHAQEGVEGPQSYGRNRVDGDSRRRLHRGRLRLQVFMQPWSMTDDAEICL